MNFVFGFVVGIAVTVCGVGAYLKYLDNSGQIMDLSDLFDEMAADGALLYIPDHFPVVADEENNKWYVDVDQIRLVVEDGELVGWYDPSGKLEA